MSPSNALLVCVFFILILLILDRRFGSRVSCGLWVPTIWMMYGGSRSIYSWLNPEPIRGAEIDYISGNPIDRTFLLLLIACGLFILSRRKIDVAEVLRRNSWIFVLFIYMGVSILWSDFMFVSFKRWIRAIGDIVMVMIVLSEDNPSEAIEELFRRSAYILIPISVVLIKYFRDIGVAFDDLGNEMWVGVTTHKNCLGYLACFSGFYFSWAIMNARLRKIVVIDILFLLMSIWLLTAPGSSGKISTTSVIIYICGVGLVLALKIIKKNPRQIGKFIFLSLLITCCLELSFGLIEIIVGASQRDMTFTGRRDLWKVLLEIGSRHPFLGVGYGNFWIGRSPHNLWDEFIWRPTTAHNGYIDVYLQLGLVGVFLLILVILLGYRNIVKTLLSNFDFGRFEITLLFMIVLYNMSESSVVRGGDLPWVILLLVSMYIPKSGELISNTKNRACQFVQ